MTRSDSAPLRTETTPDRERNDMSTAKYSPTYHRDRSVTFWSVYEQRWIRASTIPDRELAAMSTEERDRVLRHLAVTA
jgi:hypothetical protein